MTFEERKEAFKNALNLLQTIYNIQLKSDKPIALVDVEEANKEVL